VNIGDTNCQIFFTGRAFVEGAKKVAVEVTFELEVDSPLKFVLPDGKIVKIISESYNFEGADKKYFKSCMIRNEHESDKTVHFASLLLTAREIDKPAPLSNDETMVYYY
jgi:hypothetical protein